MGNAKTYEELILENAELARKLEEATDTIDAIRTGQVDALVVNDAQGGHQLYTLKTADQTYRVFIEKMNEGAVTLNEAGIILYANSKFASMVDSPLSQVVGSPFEMFVPADLLGPFRDIFASGWREDVQMELLIRRNEETLPCQLSVTTLQLDEGPSLSIIVTDLTHQKGIQDLLKANNERLEEINSELEASNYDLQQFASVASHDLQEPLRKIMIFSSMLKNKYQNEFSAESQQHLDKIVTSATRMRTMIADILNYSRLSIGSDKHEMIDLNELIGEILDDYEILISERQAQIIVEELPVIQANKAQIKQVFQNLISNSIKFSKPGQPPVIRISCKKSDENPQGVTLCHVIVSDNGIGFNAFYQERIFSLFERLNNKDKYEGSGIGLSIAKKIIEKHNGTIAADSIEGEGAVFTISLPLLQPTSQQA